MVMKFILILLILIFLEQFICDDSSETFSILYDSLNDTPRTCLSNNRTRNVNHVIYPDRSVHPVLIPSAAWSSSRATGAVVYILLTEVMGYATKLMNVNTVLDDQPVNYVAGCYSSTDGSCQQRNASNPRLHFTIESWMLGIRRASNLPSDAQPHLLSVMDFSADDSYFLWQSVFDEGFSSSSPELLDDFRFYDSKKFKPHRYFHPWTRILEQLPPKVLVRCSDMSPDGLNVRNTTHYSLITGDLDTSCHDDIVWFAPACRHNVSECVPLVVQYNVDNAMQLAWWYDLPFAIAVVSPGSSGNYSEFYGAVRASRMLFHWTSVEYLPDDQGRPPILLQLPRTNMLEQLAGIYRTGIEDIKPRNYGWPGLAAADRLVAFFASHLSFFEEDMRAMMTSSGTLRAAGHNDLEAGWTAACAWVRGNEGRWSAWIPADCPRGRFLDESLTACLPCPPGSICAGRLAAPSPCPAGSYCPAGSEVPVPCPNGRRTSGSGGASAENCSECVGLSDLFSSGVYLKADATGSCVCNAGSTQLGSKCVPLFVPVLLGSAALLVLAMASCALKAATAKSEAVGGEEQRILGQAVEVLRERLRIQRRDGFSLSSERGPGLRRCNESLDRLQVEAAARLALMREDAEMRLVDGFCSSLQGAGRDSELRSWLLDVVRALLDPAEIEDCNQCFQPPALAKFSHPVSAALSAVMRKLSGQKSSAQVAPNIGSITPIVLLAAGGCGFASQVDRHDYFNRKIRRLRLLRDPNFFLEVKGVAQEYMGTLAAMCTERYWKLIAEPRGSALVRCHEGVTWEVDLQRCSSSPRPRRSTDGSISRPRIYPSSDLLWLSEDSQAAPDVQLGATRESHDHKVTQSCENSRQAVIEGIIDQNDADRPDLNRKSEKFGEIGLNCSYRCEAWTSTGNILQTGKRSCTAAVGLENISEELLRARQDHVQIMAVRVSGIDCREAAAQAAAHISAGHASRRPSCANEAPCCNPKFLLNEDVFVSQLANRARLLNADFQRSVLAVIRSHAVDGNNHSDPQSPGKRDILCFKEKNLHNLQGGRESQCSSPGHLSGSSCRSVSPGRARRVMAQVILAVTGYGNETDLIAGREDYDQSTGDAGSGRTVLMCSFQGCTAAPVEVHSAPPKGIARMREKLRKYAAPHPKAIWPLSANILDPLRASVICRGPSQMLEVLGWFADSESRVGMRVCRLKNKFSFSESEIVDGYRDLKICVSFEGECGLRIIGEIQIHDAELFQLKQKMHKLYTIQRTENSTFTRCLSPAL